MPQLSKEKLIFLTENFFKYHDQLKKALRITPIDYPKAYGLFAQSLIKNMHIAEKISSDGQHRFVSHQNNKGEDVQSELHLESTHHYSGLPGLFDRSFSCAEPYNGQCIQSNTQVSKNALTEGPKNAEATERFLKNIKAIPINVIFAFGKPGEKNDSHFNYYDITSLQLGDITVSQKSKEQVSKLLTVYTLILHDSHSTDHTVTLIYHNTPDALTPKYTVKDIWKLYQASIDSEKKHQNVVSHCSAGAMRSTISALSLKFAREGVFSNSVSEDAIKLDLDRYCEALFEVCEKRPAIRPDPNQFRLILVLTIAFSAFEAGMTLQDLPQNFAELLTPKHTLSSYSQFSLGLKVSNPHPKNSTDQPTEHTPKTSPTAGLHNK